MSLDLCHASSHASALPFLLALVASYGDVDQLAARETARWTTDASGGAVAPVPLHDAARLALRSDPHMGLVAMSQHIASLNREPVYMVQDRITAVLDWASAADAAIERLRDHLDDEARVDAADRALRGDKAAQVWCARMIRNNDLWAPRPSYA